MASLLAVLRCRRLGTVQPHHRVAGVLPDPHGARHPRRHADEIVGLAADIDALRIVELGAGSADKTRLLLSAAVDRQDTVIYEPVDVSPSALEEAQERIEREIPGVIVMPRVEDYTRRLELDPPNLGERRLVLYIGSSIGNFEPMKQTSSSRASGPRWFQEMRCCWASIW